MWSTSKSILRTCVNSAAPTGRSLAPITPPWHSSRSCALWKRLPELKLRPPPSFPIGCQPDLSTLNGDDGSCLLEGPVRWTRMAILGFHGRESAMMTSLRRALREMAIPLVGALLLTLFILLQLLGTPQALGGLGFLSLAQTSSPRATLESFRADTSRATALLMDAYGESRSEPGLSLSESVNRKAAEADALLARAAQTLDLRDIPPVELEHRRLESVILLKEILDRVPLPDLGAVPGDDEVTAKPPTSWNVPGTDLRIVRIADGPRTGEYLFSSSTVLRLEGIYRLVRNEPHLSGAQT